MEYLTREEALGLHYAIIAKTGGLHGIRDLNLFDSIIERPKGSFNGRELYIGAFAKAAVYLEGFAKFHVFIDGNKRTAFASAKRFLYLNSINLVPNNKEVESFMLTVISQNLDISSIATWLKENSEAT